MLDESEPAYLEQQGATPYGADGDDKRKEPDIYSSPRDLRDLAQTPAWQDIKRRLLYSLMARRDALEIEGAHCSRADEVIGNIAYIQGEIYYIRTMLEMPERLARQKEMELENDNQT